MECKPGRLSCFSVDFSTLGRVASVVADNDFNIAKIERLSPLQTFADANEISVLEMIIESNAGDKGVVQFEALRKALVPIQKETDCDLALQREGLRKRQKRNPKLK